MTVNSDMQAALDQQRTAFIAKFGRAPGPNDPILFDPDFDVPTPFTPEKLTAIMTKAMTDAMIRPALIYAFKKTGIIVSEENAHLISNRDKKRWRRAIQDFERGVADE